MKKKKKLREMPWAALEFFISSRQCTACPCLSPSPRIPLCSLPAGSPPVSGKLSSHTGNKNVLSHFLHIKAEAAGHHLSPFA